MREDGRKEGGRDAKKKKKKKKDSDLRLSNPFSPRPAGELNTVQWNGAQLEFSWTNSVLSVSEQPSPVLFGKSLQGTHVGHCWTNTVTQSSTAQLFRSLLSSRSKQFILPSSPYTERLTADCSQFISYWSSGAERSVSMCERVFEQTCVCVYTIERGKNREAWRERYGKLE